MNLSMRSAINAVLLTNSHIQYAFMYCFYHRISTQDNRYANGYY